MSIGAHRCNQKGCDGFIVFDNADFNFRDIPTNKEMGCYSFDEPTCSECNKEFLVVPHYIVIDVLDKDLGDYEELEPACITEWERHNS